MVGAARTEELDRLKQYLRARAPLVEKKSTAVIESGIDALDRLLEGGIPKGGISVLVGKAGVGRMSVAAQLLAHETRKKKHPVAWVDANETLYPPALAQAGVDLDRLLLVRGARERTFYALEQIAASGAFSIVVASGADPWINAARARRLQTATEGANIGVVLLLDAEHAAMLPAKSMELRLTKKGNGIQAELTKHRMLGAGRKTTLAKL